jgi:hypothetical protein
MPLEWPGVHEFDLILFYEFLHGKIDQTLAPAINPDDDCGQPDLRAESG